MFLMVFIFLVILVFSILNSFVKEISTFVGRYLYSVSDDELDLRAKVRDLKDQQSHISMMDEFARYMKLQRQIDKLVAQVKESGTSRQKQMTMLRMGLQITFYVIHGLVMLSLVVSHRTQPLVLLPTGWFFPCTEAGGLTFRSFRRCGHCMLDSGLQFCHPSCQASHGLAV